MRFAANLPVLSVALLCAMSAATIVDVNVAPKPGYTFEESWSTTLNNQYPSYLGTTFTERFYAQELTYATGVNAGGDMTINCLDSRSGCIYWNVTLPIATSGQSGSVSEMTVGESLLVVLSTQPGLATVYAVNKSNGLHAWTTSLPNPSQSPYIFTAQAAEIQGYVYAGSNQRVYALDAISGAIDPHWYYYLLASSISGKPMYYAKDDLIILPDGCSFFAVKPCKPNQKAAPATQWTFSTPNMSPKVGCSVAYSTLSYDTLWVVNAVNYFSKIFMVDPANGKLLNAPAANTTYPFMTINMVTAGLMVYAATFTHVCGIDPLRGTVVWNNSIPLSDLSRLYTLTAFDNSLVTLTACGGSGSSTMSLVVAYIALTGKPHWEFAVTGRKPDGAFFLSSAEIGMTSPSTPTMHSVRVFTSASEQHVSQNNLTSYQIIAPATPEPMTPEPTTVPPSPPPCNNKIVVTNYLGSYSCDGKGVQSTYSTGCTSSARSTSSTLRFCSQGELHIQVFASSGSCAGMPSSVLAYPVGKCTVNADGSVEVNECGGV